MGTLACAATASRICSHTLLLTLVLPSTDVGSDFVHFCGRVAVGGRAAGVDTRLAVVWVTCGGLLAAFSVRYARDRPAASTFLGFVPSFLLYSLFFLSVFFFTERKSL